MATKKAVTKTETKKEVTPKKDKGVYLTEKQFQTIKNFVIYNEIEEIEEIATSGEDDMKTIGFQLGTIYTNLSKSITEIGNIVDEIEEKDLNLEW